MYIKAKIHMETVRKTFGGRRGGGKHRQRKIFGLYIITQDRKERTEHRAQDTSAKVLVQDHLQNGFQLLSMRAAKKNDEPCRSFAHLTFSGQP